VMTNFPLLVTQKEVRDKRRYSQREIAVALGVSEPTVSRWMNGKRIENTSIKIVMKLCNWLDCDLRDLVYTEATEANL